MSAQIGIFGTPYVWRSSGKIENWSISFVCKKSNDVIRKLGGPRRRCRGFRAMRRMLRYYNDFFCKQFFSCQKIFWSLRTVRVRYSHLFLAPIPMFIFFVYTSTINCHFFSLVSVRTTESRSPLRETPPWNASKKYFFWTV